MRSYKYRLIKNKKWRFELLPNNNNKQYVGYSSDYETKEMALNGLNKFIKFLQEQKSSLNYIKETVYKNGSKCYYAFFVFSSENEQFFTRKYEQKSEPDNSIQRIINNFNVSIRNDLMRIKET